VLDDSMEEVEQACMRPAIPFLNPTA
jgi:hypothetical protein